MIYDIGNNFKKIGTNSKKEILLHEGNDMLPLIYPKMDYLNSYPHIHTLENRLLYRGRYTYYDLSSLINSLRFNRREGYYLLNISNTNLILGREFCYDRDKNKVLYSVVASKELIENSKRISSDQCLLYISDHFKDFSNTFKTTVLSSFDNFLGDMVITKYSNQMVLGHPLFKPKSKKEINEKLKTLIDGL